MGGEGAENAGHRRGKSEREARRRDRVDLGFIGGNLGESVEDLSRPGFTARSGPMDSDRLHLLPVEPSISAGSTNRCGAWTIPAIDSCPGSRISGNGMGPRMVIGFR